MKRPLAGARSAVCWRRQDALHGLLTDAQTVYRDLDERVETVHAKQTKTELKKIEDLLLHDAVVTRIRRIFQEPKMIFVGQTNAGKSSLINELLGATVVKALDTPCTSRIVELKYGNMQNPVVEIYSKDDELIETKYMDHSYISPGIADLPDEDRNNVKLIGSKVVAGVNNDFLRSGVTVVDSPGKNEITELDKLVEEHVESILPLVVYVIDGRNMLTKTDKEDIECLRNKLPEGNIFFAVTKCDNDGGNDTERDSDSDEEDDALQPTELEKDIRHGIYTKLTDGGLLEGEIDQCTTYHTLSSRRVKKYRWAQRKSNRTPEDEQTLRECERFMRDFQRFKTCLLQFVERQLLKLLIENCEKLEESLSACLDYFIETNNVLFENKEKTEKNFVVVETEANKLKDIQLNTICADKSSVKAAVTGVLNNKRAAVLQLAETYRFEVPADQQVSAELLKNLFLNDILGLIGNLIRDELLQKNSPLQQSFNDLQRIAREIQEKVGDESDSNNALQKMFVGYCQLDISGTDLTLPMWRRLLNFVKRFASKFKQSKQSLDFWFEKIADFISRSVFPGNIRSHDLRKEWRELLEGIERFFSAADRKTVAKEILLGIKPDKLADEIIQFLTSFVEEGHSQFIEQLTGLRVLFNEGCVHGDNEVIRQMAPRVARLLMTAWDIQDRLRYRNVVYGKVLGRGGQGYVRECDIIAPNGQSCAVKQLNVSSSEMDNLGLKIHYARMLKHKNILEVVGVMYEHNEEEEYAVSIIMPRMRGNLTAILPTIRNLKERLLIGLKVGQALEYTHGQKLSHWDIKCENILVAHNDEVKISDFVLCKSTLIEASSESLPIFVPPEITQTYTEKADVYSFGVLLWYVYEGQGRSPVYVKTCRGVQDVLGKIGCGARPEKLPDMRDDCYDLMQRCWAAEPSSRPTMETVNIQLKEILDKIM